MRAMLQLLLGFVAASAIVGGLVLCFHPQGAFEMTTALLQPSPFNSFLIPGLILCIVVGGANLLALLRNLQNAATAFRWTLIAGLMTCGWMVVQIMMIQQFFWMQWLYLLAGFFTLLMALQMKHKSLI